MNSSKEIQKDSIRTVNTDTTIYHVPPLNPSFNIRFGGASINLFFALISLTLNLLLLTILIKCNNKFKTMSFFIISWQMLICDFCGLVAQLFMSTPLTLAGYDLYGPTIRHVFGIFDTISFHGSLFFVFLLAINRFMVFILPKINHVLFEAKRIYVPILLTWLLTLGFTLALELSGCYRTFFLERFIIFLLCSMDRTLVSWFLEQLQQQLSIYIPAVMMLMYVVLFLKVRFHLSHLSAGSKAVGTNNTTNRKEYVILIQSIILCSVFWLQNICNNLMKGWVAVQTNDDIAQILVFLCLWRTTIGNGVHAVVIFIFNSMAREEAKMLLGIRGQENTTFFSTATKTKTQTMVKRRGTIA